MSMFGQKKMKNALKLRYFGDPVLAAKAKEIPEITDEIRSLAADMLEMMYEKNGIGLAGNQVGIPQKIVVIDIEPPEDEDGNPLPLTTPGEMELLPKMPIALINPKILSTSDDLTDFDEGCLSVPKLYANVKRPSRVVLQTQLIDGTTLTAECGGLLARVLQHELDHLDGIVFVQKADEADYKEIQAGVEKLIRKNGPRGFQVRRLV